MASLIQLNYALTLAKEQSFQKAAKKCFVTQPTLSMQIQKLEDELDIIIFDRSRKPVVPTAVGEKVLLRFRRVLDEYELIARDISDEIGLINGDYVLGVLPTIAPALVPELLRLFRHHHPDLHLTIRELTTKDIIARLKDGTLDGGILSTPLHDHGLKETKIYDEPLVLFAGPTFKPSSLKHGRIDPATLSGDSLLMLNEGHCLRTQTLDLCQLASTSDLRQDLETNSLLTLVRVLESESGFTVLPLFLARIMSDLIKGSRFYPFSKPTPCREISLVTHRSMIKSAVNAEIVAFTMKTQATLKKDWPSEKKLNIIDPI